MVCQVVFGAFHHLLGLLQQWDCLIAGLCFCENHVVNKKVQLCTKMHCFITDASRSRTLGTVTHSVLTLSYDVAMWQIALAAAYEGDKLCSRGKIYNIQDLSHMKSPTHEILLNIQGLALRAECEAEVRCKSWTQTDCSRQKVDIPAEGRPCPDFLLMSLLLGWCNPCVHWASWFLWMLVLLFHPLVLQSCSITWHWCDAPTCRKNENGIWVRQRKQKTTLKTKSVLHAVMECILALTPS